jgi:SNF2 family DNA or RNA helicase
VIYRGRFNPYEHQRITAEFLYDRRRAFCFNDIGTGKTLSALWALDNRMARRINKRVIIVSPKSTVHHVWGREIFQTTPNYKTVELLGSRAKRKKLLDSNPDIVIVNPHHAALDVIIDHPWSDEVDMLLLDESTAFKNHKAQVYKNLVALIRPGATVWMMSGSPMPQAPTDIWAQAKIICPDEVHKSFSRFRDWSMYKIGQFQWVPRPHIEEKIADLLADHTVRFTRDECLDLPEATFDKIEVFPTAEYLEIEAKLKREAVIALEEGKLTAANEGVYITKILQAACGAVKYVGSDGNDKVHEVDCKYKIEQLDSVLDSTSQPVILFSPFRAPIPMLERYAIQRGIKYAVVHGSVSQSKRNEAFDALNSGEIKLLIAQPDSMSHGLTLVESNVICWWGLPNKVETYTQANGRIIREGQTRKQYIIHLISCPLEQRVYDRLYRNLSIQGTLLDLLAND